MACMGFIILAAMATFPIVASAGLMDITNAFPYYDLEVQCESRTEHLPVHIIAPNEAYRFDFDPATQEFWRCTVVTSPRQRDGAHGPVPFLWGRFHFYVREAAFRACSDVCRWVADDAGMALMLKPGDRRAHIYSWSAHH